MSSIIKLGRHVESISSRYVCFFPAFQAAPDSLTTIIDRSGKGNHAVAGTSGIGASAWANANCFTGSTATNYGAYISKGASEAWTWDDTSGVKDTVIWSSRIYTPNAAANDTLFRTGTSSATGGWWVETAATGYTGSTPGVRLKMYDTVDGTQQSVGHCSLPANTWTTVGIVIDGPGNQAFMFINGNLAVVSASTNPRSLNSGTPSTSIKTMTVQAAAVAPWIISSPSGSTDVKRMNGWHWAVVPNSAGAVPNIVELMLRLHRNPFTALAESELP